MSDKIQIYEIKEIKIFNRNFQLYAFIFFQEKKIIKIIKQKDLGREYLNRIFMKIKYIINLLFICYKTIFIIYTKEKFNQKFLYKIKYK